MANNGDLGVGGAGVSGQMADDVRALSDQAKRIQATRQAAVQANAQQGLKAATGGGGQVPPSLNDQIAHHLLHVKTIQDLDPVANRGEYMNKLSEMIMEMEDKAKDVEKSKTGNIGAAQTYRQVAQILKTRLHNMQSQDAGTPQNPDLMQTAGEPVQ